MKKVVVIASRLGAGLNSDGVAAQFIGGARGAGNEEAEHVPQRGVTGLAGWIDCYPKSRHAGTLFCGGVTIPRDIAGNHKLQAAYELGKNIQ